MSGAGTPVQGRWVQWLRGGYACLGAVAGGRCDVWVRLLKGRCGVWVRSPHPPHPPHRTHSTMHQTHAPTVLHPNSSIRTQNSDLPYAAILGWYAAIWVQSPHCTHRTAPTAPHPPHRTHGTAPTAPHPLHRTHCTASTAPTTPTAPHPPHPPPRTHCTDCPHPPHPSTAPTAPTDRPHIPAPHHLYMHPPVRNTIENLDFITLENS